MSPEAQQIAIAEACPETFFIHHGRIYLKTGPNIAPQVDPLSDLNAMHEAEKVLTQKQRDKYAEILFGMLRDCSDDYAPVWAMTAAQRAEAFLRTLNLWDDTK